MTQKPPQKKSTIPLIKKSSFVLVCLFLLYVIAGFWVIPPLIKPRLENELSSQIGRKVTIEKIKLNPLVLSVTTTNLIVYEIDGEPFAGFGELFVNTQLSSIVKRAVTFKEIRILAPFGVLKLFPQKKLNIEDILTKLSQSKHTPGKKFGLPPVVITKLEVKEGKISVDDLTGIEPVHEMYSPITFTLENLSTSELSQGKFKFFGVGSSGGQYQVDGQFSVNPIRIQGSYSTTGIDLSQSWEHLKDQVSFQIINGKVGASGNYTLEFLDGTINAKLQNGEFELKNFQVTEKGKDTLLISLQSFSMEGVSGNLKTQEIIVERIKTTDAKLETWLLPDGTLNLKNLLIQDLKKLTRTEKANSTESETDAGSSWHAAINIIEVDNWNATIEDRTLPEPARITFDDLTVRVKNLDNKKNSKAEISILFQLNQTGTVKLNGTACIDPLSAELEMFFDQIALKSFQPYVDTALNVLITLGTMSSKGRIVYQGNTGQPRIKYEGELSLDNTEVKDRIQTEDFIRQKQIKVSGIVLDILPNRLHVADVLINKTYANITIDKNGTVNVVQTFTPLRNKGEEEKENLLEQLINFLILQIEGPIPMSIDLVYLDDFSVDFIDQSIKPPYTTRLDITKGKMKGLSSDLSARADFKIIGTIDKSAIIESGGQMNPLNAMQYTKVNFVLKDFDLKSVSSYSGKYIGYKISEGTLHLDLEYRVDDNSVNGNNRIMIDQLTLGDMVDSPDAIDLPVVLGVTLLKHADGRISLQVPVEGNVEDPKFNFGQAIISGLIGSVNNVINSPFSAIPFTDGFKGEELGFVEFEFGHADLSVYAKKKLDTLAKILKGRPALILSIEGTADREMDWVEMSGRQGKKEESANDIKLQKLAEKRANSVNEYLLKKGKLAAKRMQIKPVKIISSTQKEYAIVELHLSAQ